MFQTLKLCFRKIRAELKTRTFLETTNNFFKYEHFLKRETKVKTRTFSETTNNYFKMRTFYEFLRMYLYFHLYFQIAHNVKTQTFLPRANKIFPHEHFLFNILGKSLLNLELQEKYE